MQTKKGENVGNINFAERSGNAPKNSVGIKVLRKINAGQKRIDTNEDIRPYGYIKSGTRSGKISWLLKSYNDERHAGRKGNRGKYRGKEFYYKNKILEGCDRHHVFYDDSDPNKGIYLMTKAGHAKFHRDLKRNIMIDITAYKNLKVGEEVS